MLNAHMVYFKSIRSFNYFFKGYNFTDKFDDEEKIVVDPFCPVPLYVANGLCSRPIYQP